MSSAAPVIAGEDAGASEEVRAKRKLTRADYERYLPLVRRTAMKLARRLPSHVTVADLVSYGWVGLLDAFERASPDMSEEEFEAYAVYRVRGAALDHLRALDPASRAARALSRRIARAMKSASAKQQGEEPTEEAVAAELEMTIPEYRAALERVGRAGMNRLEMVDVDDLPSHDAENAPDERAGKRELTGIVAAAIERLSERQRLVLALYYQEERTMREIGAILDVSESRVCQIHSEAIHRLRAVAGKE